MATDSIDIPRTAGWRAIVPAALFVAPLIVAAFRRLPFLSTDSLWIDEAATWDQSRGTLFDLFRQTAADNYPPLHNLVVWAMIHLFGDAEWALRLPSALLGIGTVALVFLIGKRLSGLVAATAASLLLAIAPFHVWYSLEARSYALMTFAATLFAWSFFRDREHPSAPRGLLLLVAGSLLLYSHTLGIVIFGLLASTMVLIASRRWRMVGLLGISLLTFAPWIAIALTQVSRVVGAGFWVPPLSTFRFLNGAANITSGTPPLVALLLCLGIVLTPAFPRMPLRTDKADRWLLAVWALGPFLAVTIISVTVIPLFVPRYLISTLPAFYLLAGLAIGDLVQYSRSRPVLWALVAFIVLALLFVRGPAHRPDWRNGSRAVASELSPTTCIAVVPAWQQLSLQYYLRTLPACEPSGPASSTSRVVVVSTGEDEKTLHTLVDPLVRTGWAQTLKTIPGIDLITLERP